MARRNRASWLQVEQNFRKMDRPRLCLPKRKLLFVEVRFSFEKDRAEFLNLRLGSFQTPQILELSGKDLLYIAKRLYSTSVGIGNRKLLESHGIPVLHDLPGVGQNLRTCLFFVLLG